MNHDSGLATLLKGEETKSGSFSNLHAFGFLDRTCQPDLLLGGTHEVLARAIHEEYVLHQTRIGETPQSNPSMVPWQELPEGLKESNLHQADHIGLKLQAVGCYVVPLTDWDADPLEFSEEEVEIMARMEHERFVSERLGEGWTLAPGSKDIAAKTSPYMVPWDQLSEQIKDFDRNTVKALPEFLATAGFEVVRLSRRGKFE